MVKFITDAEFHKRDAEHRSKARAAASSAFCVYVPALEANSVDRDLLLDAIEAGKIPHISIDI